MTKTLTLICPRCEGEGWLWRNTSPTMQQDKGQFRRVWCSCPLGVEASRLKAATA